jgi:glycosyltransferase involved in cell wall biosynthesis
MRGEILFVTDRRFWRRSIGSEQRIAALVRFLCGEGFRVAVAYLGHPNREDRRRAEVFRSECPGLSLVYRSRAGLERIATWLRRLRRDTAHQPRPRPARDQGSSTKEETGEEIAGRRSSPARREFVHETIADRSPRVVVVEFLRLTNLVVPRPRIEGEPPIYLIDTHDLLHERAARYRAEGLRLDHEIDLDEEARALSTFDAIVAIQTREDERLRELLPSKPVLLVPHGIEIPEPSARVAPSFPPSPVRIGFLGGRDESNVRALDWFVESVWPALRKDFDEGVELHVAGQVCSSWTAPSSNGIEIRGAIDSIETFWPEVDIAINPVRFGSGLKIKNVEALAYGRPLLTTTVGAQGLEGASPAGLAISDTADAWNDILRLWLNDPHARASIGDCGRDFARAHFSEKAAFAELSRYLAERLK